MSIYKIFPKYIFVPLLFASFIRVLTIDEIFGENFKIITYSYFGLLPFIMGVLLSLNFHRSLTLLKAFYLTILLSLLYSVTLFVVFSDTLVFVVAITPLIFFFIFLGVGIGQFLKNSIVNNKKAMLFMALLLVGVLKIESLVENNTTLFIVKDSIVISASKEKVWENITPLSIVNNNLENVSLTTLVNIPRPVEARLDKKGVGATRTSVWERGFVFHEIITKWEVNKELEYRFEFDSSNTSSRLFDKNIKPGSKYFRPIEGGYSIDDKNKEIELILFTRAQEALPFKFYSKRVLEFFLSNYHKKILTIIKKKSEREEISFFKILPLGHVV